MGNETQNRINALMGLYFSKVRVDDGLKKDFHDWFEDDGHIECKYRALELIFDDFLGFDENPSEDVVDSFCEICERLGFPDTGIETERTAAESVSGSKPRWPGSKPRRPVMLRVAAIAVPLLAVSVYGLVFFKVSGSAADSPRSGDGAVAVLTVAGSERTLILTGETERNVSLPDRSNVWINRNSSIEFDVDFTERRIALSGEAYFDVAHAEGDFIVQAGGLSAIVNGTRFNIESHPGSASTVISLYEGSLAVESPGARHYLDAGSGLRYDSDAGRLTPGSVDGSLPEWLHRAVGYVEMRIAEIFESLEMTYGTPIVIDGGSGGFADERVTLWFERAITLDGALAMIEQLSGGFTYRHDEETGEMLVMPR